MSEDKTKVLNQEPEESADKAQTTNPMLEAILARVVDLSDSFNASRDEVNTFREEVNTKIANLSDSFTALGNSFNTFREEVNTKIDVLTVDVKEFKRTQRVVHDQLLSLQGVHHELEERVDDLERKAS